ncbi:MAG: hypothetical protein FD123_1182 [Bacteroidetes bacterium]|nr:MAG: hypothetical protein FD123_1182 [Bacteroidota bacterium]
MLEFSKQILEKVSFDKFLFRKELSKAVNWVKKDELIMLHAWCITTFGAVYGDVISEVFRSTGKA